MPPKSHDGGSDPVIVSALRAACSISLFCCSSSSLFAAKALSVEAVAAGAEKTAVDDDDE